MKTYETVVNNKDNAQLPCSIYSAEVVAVSVACSELELLVEECVLVRSRVRARLRALRFTSLHCVH